MALHMSTVLSRSAADVISHLSRIRNAYPSHIPFFTLFVPSDRNETDLPSLVSHLSSLSEQSIGCLSASIPSSGDATNRSIACSVAVFDSISATPFRSTIPGREAPQVGRWHAFRNSNDDSERRIRVQGETDGLQWDDIWTRRNGGYVLPQELSAIKPEEAHTVLFLSDASPEGLSDSLGVFRSATKVGLIASSTPFVTGRPYTLFHGRSIYSSGAVGLCLTSPPRPRAHLEFPGLVSLTAPMPVTRSEGNLIQSLDNANPARLLLLAIEHANRKPGVSSRANSMNIDFKDDTFYLAVVNGSREKHELSQLLHITAGDPSRGTLAVQSELAPPEGTLVQIFRLPGDTSPDTLSRYLQNHSQATSRQDPTMAFSVSASDLMPDRELDNVEDQTFVLTDTFLAASENGFVLSRYSGLPDSAEEHAWLCKTPGGLAELRWSA